MSIQFGGIASGLPVNDIIEQLLSLERRPIELLEQKVFTLNNEEAQYQNLRSRVSSLNSSLETLLADSVLDDNLFQSKIGTVADSSVATVTADTDAAPQTFSLEVISLATATTASSLNEAGRLATGGSNVSDVAQGLITDGTFSVFDNGSLVGTITVDTATDTLTDVLNDIQTAIGGGITATVNASGQIELNGAGVNTVTFGASGDTSNFLAATGLDTAQLDGPMTTLTASKKLTEINLSGDIESNAANLTTAVSAGSSFTIGSATFTTAGKSLSELMSEINNSADAGVTISYNTTSNAFEMVSDEPGSSAITLSDDAGNFLEAVGLITPGNMLAAQTLGNNAEIEINGNTIFSSTNSVSEAVSGITGVTIDLLSTNAGSPTTVSVGRDTAPLKDAINEFITTFNEVTQFITTQTDAESETAILKNENNLKRFKSQLKQTALGLLATSGSFNSLQNVGISTGAIGGSSNGNLVFDEAAFDTAFATSPADVEEVMIGSVGALRDLFNLTDSALHDDAVDSQDGLFAAHTSSVNSQIDRLNQSILRAEERLLRREEQLRRQFTAMENTISQFNSQGAALSGLISQLSANASA